MTKTALAAVCTAVLAGGTTSGALAQDVKETIYATEKKMVETSRRPVQAGSPMKLETIAGRVIVFEWEDPGKVEQAGSDLTIKNILYVVMPPASAG
jgi:hypothetical protein